MKARLVFGILLFASDRSINYRQHLNSHFSFIFHMIALSRIFNSHGGVGII